MLSDKIWKTRKARIYTEKRLQNKAILSQILMTVYSSILVFFSIWNLLYPIQQGNILLIFGSIAVLVTSIVLSSQKYTERSLAMRNCYIRLDEINAKAERAEKSNDINNIEQLEKEYADHLLNLENHSDYDYLCLRFSLRNDENAKFSSFGKKDYIRYFWEKLWRGLLILIYFIPILLLFLWQIAFKNVSI